MNERLKRVLEERSDLTGEFHNELSSLMDKLFNNNPANTIVVSDNDDVKLGGDKIKKKKIQNTTENRKLLRKVGELQDKINNNERKVIEILTEREGYLSKYFKNELERIQSRSLDITQEWKKLFTKKGKLRESDARQLQKLETELASFQKQIEDMKEKIDFHSRNKEHLASKYGKLITENQRRIRTMWRDILRATTQGKSLKELEIDLRKAAQGVQTDIPNVQERIIFASPNPKKVKEARRVIYNLVKNLPSLNTPHYYCLPKKR